MQTRLHSKASHLSSWRACSGNWQNYWRLNVSRFKRFPFNGAAEKAVVVFTRRCVKFLATFRRKNSIAASKPSAQASSALFRPSPCMAINFVTSTRIQRCRRFDLTCSSLYDRQRLLCLVPFGLGTVDVLKEFIRKCPLVTGERVVTGRNTPATQAGVEDRRSGQGVDVIAGVHRLYVMDDDFYETRQVRIIASARNKVVREGSVLVLQI